MAQFPTYVGAIDAWRPRQPVYQALDWSAETGTSIEAIAGAKFVYTVPNYSNPTGVLVPTAARQALLEKVMKAGTWLVEDDPYLPLQYDGEAGPSMLALHGRILEADGPYDGPVIYLGTLSKSIVPGLRVGWTIASSDDDPGAGSRQAIVRHQQLDADAGDRARASRGWPRGGSRAVDRADTTGSAATRSAPPQHAELSEWFEWDTPPGGMFVWMRARWPAIDTDSLYRFALAEKVAFVPGSVFDPAARLRSAMRVNFTRNRPDVLQEGVAAACRRDETIPDVE